MVEYRDNLKFKVQDMIPFGIGAVLQIYRFSKDSNQRNERLNNKETFLLVGYYAIQVSTMATIPEVVAWSGLLEKLTN